MKAAVTLLIAGSLLAGCAAIGGNAGPRAVARLAPTKGNTIGKGLIVHHRDPDDYKSQPAGNAGPRLACAVIAKSS